MGATVSPRRRLRAALPYLVVLAVGGVLYHVADRFEFEDVGGRIGPGAWPKIVLILMLLTALWGAISAVLKADEPEPRTDEVDQDEALVRPPEIHPWRVWLVIAATLGYLLVLPRLGFALATAAFSFALMYLGHYRRPWQAALLGVAIPVAFLFLFMRVVYVALPVGIAPFDRVSYALMAAMGVH